MEADILPPVWDEPKTWVLVFAREGEGWARYVPGRYKHVRAYAYLPGMKAWILYDPHRSGVDIKVIHDRKEALTALYHFTWQSDLMRFPASPGRTFFPVFFTCVGAIKHLIGLRSRALILGTFHRHCLAAGGVALAEEDANGSRKSTRLYPDTG